MTAKRYPHPPVQARKMARCRLKKCSIQPFGHSGHTGRPWWLPGWPLVYAGVTGCRVMSRMSVKVKTAEQNTHDTPQKSEHKATEKNFTDVHCRSFRSKCFCTLVSNPNTFHNRSSNCGVSRIFCNNRRHFRES